MKSVFTKEEPGEMPTLEPKVNSDQHIDEAHFTIQDVAAKLKDRQVSRYGRDPHEGTKLMC